MSKLEQLYALRKDGKTVKTGTVTEIADYSGLTVKTVYSYASSTKRNRWEVIQINTFLPLGTVDVGRIRQAMKAQKYSAQRLANDLGMSRSSLNIKLAEKTRFKESEIQHIEKLFHLSEGSLIL